MENLQQANVYFWTQKKNDLNENMVIINGAFSTFDKLPHEIRFFNPNKLGEIQFEQTAKTKISVRLKRRQIGEERKNLQVICINGWINEKDSSNRNLAYTFCYVTQKKIDANALTITEKEIKKCMEMIGSASFFDEDDFNICLSRIDPYKCNNEVSELRRDYEDSLCSVVDGCSAIVKKVVRHPKATIFAAVVLVATGFVARIKKDK